VYNLYAFCKSSENFAFHFGDIGILPIGMWATILELLLNLHVAAQHCVETGKLIAIYIYIYTVCPTRYRTRHFFNNFTTNEDIATKFEADLPHCLGNVTTS